MNVTNPSTPAATVVGIVIDPYARSISAQTFLLSDSLQALQAVVGGMIEAMHLRKHDHLLVNEEALLRIGSPNFPFAGFRFDERTFFGRGVIIAERVNTLPRPEITVDEVSRRTTWLNANEARAAHAAIVAEHSAPAHTCPSSNALRQRRRLANGGSDPSGWEVRRRVADGSSVAVGWSGA